MFRKKRKKLTKIEAQALHEQIALDKFAAYELTESHDFENRQKARNILRYQVRGYCFELPPKCSRWGHHCTRCRYFKCRENEQYDGVKWEHDFDPDIDRFVSLFDCLETIAAPCNHTNHLVQHQASKVDTGASLTSLLTKFANTAI